MKYLLLIALSLITSVCQAADQVPRPEAKSTGLENLRVLTSSKRVVDESGRLVGKDLVIDNTKGSISFTPVPIGTEKIYPKLCSDGINCSQPVKAEKLPSIGESLKMGASSNENQCEPYCVDTEVCRRCPSPQYPSDVCCVTKTVCTRCPPK